MRSLSCAVAVALAVALVPVAAAEARAGVDRPRPDAVVKRLPVRVVVRPPAGASSLRVHVGNRDVTGRFRRVGRSRLVGVLSRRQGLRYGWNEVSVLRGRGAGLRVVEASSFVLARRVRSLARLAVRPGAVTSLSVRGGRARRERSVRVLLNGRHVTRALDLSHPLRWKAQLSATHGLRPGVNRLRVLVVEPDRGRHAVLRRRFVVRRGTHLPGAGWDVATGPDLPVRLDGRRSRASGGGRVRHRWRVLSKPRGSRPRLRRAGSPGPVLIPDRPGRYVVGVRVARRGSRAVGSLSVTDKVTVTATPNNLLVPFTGLKTNVGANRDAGIQVGDTFYPNTSPIGNAIQWLTLNRATLELAGDGNSYLDGTADGAHGLDHLKDQLEKGMVDQLVVLALPYTAARRAVDEDQIGAFEEALRMIGATQSPVPPREIVDRMLGFSAVGIPHAGAGTGWMELDVGPVGADRSLLTGWLMPSRSFSAKQAPLYRLQPERPKFDTSLEVGANTNTMLLGKHRVTGSLPIEFDGGFHVVSFDPITLEPRKSEVFLSCCPGAAAREASLSAMADFLRSVPPDHVAIQSIGLIGAELPGDHPPEERANLGWYRVGAEISKLGGNPHTFNTVDPFSAESSYAFVGGADLGKDEVRDASTGLGETGDLQGRMSLGHDGVHVPLVADPTERREFSLYDTVFRDPTPWPYTAAAGHPDADAYARALADITSALGFGGYNGDLRQAYYRNLNIVWSDDLTKLATLRYGGDNRTCLQEPGPSRAQSPGYTREQFCTLVHQLEDEFTWIDRIRNNLFRPWSNALDSGSATQHADLQAIGKLIHDRVKAAEDAGVAWSVGALLGKLITAVLTVQPEAEEAFKAWEALVAMYEVGREMADITDPTTQTNAPVSEQVNTKVEDLGREIDTKITATRRTLEALRAVINSDYGRLRELGSVANNREWTVQEELVADKLTAAAKASFASELVPIPYGVHALQKSSSASNPWTLQRTGLPAPRCTDLFYGNTFDGSPPTAQMPWMGNYEVDGYHGWWPTLLALGRHDLRDGSYPPASLTDEMFRPVGQNGFGVQLARFMWEEYDKGPPTNIYICNSQFVP